MIALHRRLSYPFRCHAIAPVGLPAAALPALLVAVMLAFAAVPAVADDSLSFGRLFTEPATRAELDKIRYAKKAPRAKVNTDTSQPTLAEPEPEVILKGFRYDGMVQRSGGPSTAWVDGRPVLMGGRDEQGLELDLSRRNKGDLQVQLPKGEERVRLRPGQVFDPGPGGIPYTGAEPDGSP